MVRLMDRRIDCFCPVANISCVSERVNVDWYVYMNHVLY